MQGQKFIPIFHMRYPTNEINHSSSNVPIKRGHGSEDSKSERTELEIIAMTLWENLPQYVALVLLVVVSLFIS